MEGHRHGGEPTTDSAPAILIIVESFGALSKVMTTVSMDWADTPDVRDRLTRSDVEQLVKDALDSILSRCPAVAVRRSAL